MSTYKITGYGHTTILTKADLTHGKDLEKALLDVTTCRSICALGAKGTGKSYFCLALVRKLMDANPKMQLVLYAPALTNEQNNSYAFLEKYRAEGRARLWDEFDNKSLTSVYEQQKKSIEAYEADRTSNPEPTDLIIMFDDATAYNAELFIGPLIRLVMITRHIRIIPIVVIHALMLGGKMPSFRVNVDKLILFKLTNVGILNNLFDEYMSLIPQFRDIQIKRVTPRRAFYQFYDNITSDQYGGLYFDMFSSQSPTKLQPRSIDFMCSTLEFSFVKEFTDFLKTFKPIKYKKRDVNEILMQELYPRGGSNFIARLVERITGGLPIGVDPYSGMTLEQRIERVQGHHGRTLSTLPEEHISVSQQHSRQNSRVPYTAMHERKYTPFTAQKARMPAYERIQRHEQLTTLPPMPTTAVPYGQLPPSSAASSSVGTTVNIY